MSKNELSNAIVFRLSDGVLTWNNHSTGKDGERVISDIEASGGSVVAITSIRKATILVDGERRNHGDDLFLR